MVCVSGGKKCSLFGKFGVLYFLEAPVLRFASLPYYQQLQYFEAIDNVKQLILTFSRSLKPARLDISAIKVNSFLEFFFLSKRIRYLAILFWAFLIIT